jgi:protoporphyrinogen IX oxidase
MNWYLTFKVIHIVAVIAWMAGIFYLPRLFVYHAEAGPGTSQSETFKVMERRLLRGIMLPSMILTWIGGIGVATAGGFWSDGWLSAKLVLVIFLTGYHFWLARQSRAFTEDRNQVPAKTYRILNEVPVLVLIAIVILVVVKPF